MKKALFLLVMLPLILFAGCSDDEEKDEFYQRQVTALELESGTATWETKYGSATHYLLFEEGHLIAFEYKNREFTNRRYFDSYKIEGDSIYLIEKGTYGAPDKNYSLYINIVHWGFDKKDSEDSTGGEQLLIRGDKDKLPYKFRDGYYDKSSISLSLKQ